ncbi:MobP2 family relaxase [Leuconostoc pseudomesenteroides]|uniref:MobP2 family relaxase n=1 Tax=Leuconostoc pseudomesenteroides TaxID=33968 RepID=UPI001E4A21A4|nr:MobP2 family relaxase [Leuconostoc pseudomesenteroides]MCC8439770.1 IS110 family transposase [Leuconostoc pseudomesenteroides]MCT4413580.1 IS110 family transposase [Leuconostoc pseudomesenteroides]
MAKTGEIAAFALGEKKTAMVNLPAQFVTSSTADMKGQKYSDLVDYANNSEKTNDLNNESMNDLIDLKEQFGKPGYANRNSAVTETHPIFGIDKLNYDNHDISVLRKDLDEAQKNGNNIHELAFSIRGDWLVKNNLYDPETRMIDQNKLKHAEQEVAKTLINKGFNLSLGEDENDVVWFGVIHQDTDHLNMHLWFAKKSQETRPEMIKQEGKYKGQPIGVIPLELIEQAKRQFRKQLMSSQELRRHQEILKGVGGFKQEIVEAAPENLLNDRHAKAIKQIYDALPQDMKGRWQVGNAHLTAGKGKMAQANQLTNQLLDDLFAKELKTEYEGFKALAQEYDAMNIEDQGVMHKGQRKWSENKEEELKKRLANQLYKHLAQIEDTSINDIDQQMSELLSHVKKRDKGNNVGKTKISSSPQEKKLNSKSLTNTAKQNSKHIGDQMPLRGGSFNKISRLWRQGIRDETNAERQFLRNQKKAEQEKAQEEYESQRLRKY